MLYKLSHEIGTAVTIVVGLYIAYLLISGAVKDVRSLPVEKQMKRKAFYLSALSGAFLVYMALIIWGGELMATLDYYKQHIPTYTPEGGFIWRRILPGQIQVPTVNGTDILFR